MSENYFVSCNFSQEEKRESITIEEFPSTSVKQQYIKKNKWKQFHTNY